MPDQVQDRIKTERVKVLEQLCDRFHTEFVSMCAGLHAPVLWESTCHDGKMAGYTPNYIRLEAPWDPALVGTIGEATIH